MLGDSARDAPSSDDHAERIYRMSGHHCACPPGPCALIDALGGEVLFGDYVAPGDADIVLGTDGWSLVIRSGQKIPAACASLGLGIARWYCLVFRVHTDCPPNRLAATILIPRAALALFVAAFGASPAHLAEQFAVPDAVARFRLSSMGPPKKSGQYIRMP